MSTMRWLKLPFKYTTNKDFEQKLYQWLTNVFYEILPRHGFETREEQIYTSLRIANALCRGQQLFAEAGSGTGKTFAYLLPSLCYARKVGKPVIVSSASSMLQEQLLGKEGDIETLSRILQLDISASLSKEPSNYLCDVKLNTFRYDITRRKGKAKLLRWAKATTSGDKAEIPNIAKDLWSLVAWDETQQCDVCKRRGYCRLAQMRRNLWKPTDFIVCSHKVFFQDLWARREKLVEIQKTNQSQFFGQYTSDNNSILALPQYASVVFDEGHLVEEPAISTLGRSLQAQTIFDIAQGIVCYSGLRAELLQVSQDVEDTTCDLFASIREHATPNVSMQKWHIEPAPMLKEKAYRLCHLIEILQDSLTLESQLQLGTRLEADFSVFQQRLDLFADGLRLFCNVEDIITWWHSVDQTLWVLPRHFAEMLGKELLGQQIPTVFTSATLAVGASFDSVKRVVGLLDASTSQVDTTFNLAEQVKIYYPDNLPHDVNTKWRHIAAQYCLKLLHDNHGSALILCSRQEDVSFLHEFFHDKKLSFRMYWEDDGDSGWLAEKFRKDFTSVLVGTEYWEGMDVPGDSLSLVIVFRLPFPAHDPIILAKRKAVEWDGFNPFEAVDMPTMLLKLRQGFGRLIRSQSDYGTIVVLDEDRYNLSELLPQSWAECLRC